MKVGLSNVGVNFQSDKTNNEIKDTNLTIIEASNIWTIFNLGELWKYRELLYFLVWRDVKVRYKQTVFGVAWAVIQPLLTVIVFSIFLGRLARVPSDEIPYPLFCFVALLPWTFFASGLTQSSNSLVGNTNLITKVYFPRLVIPISSVFVGFLDFFIAFVILFGLLIFYKIHLTAAVIWLPVFIVLMLIITLAMGLWLSALNVHYRDIRYAIPFLTQFWFFATPIAYSSSLLSEPWRTLYGLNPLVGVVDGFRWALFASTPSLSTIGLSGVIAVMLFVTGIYYFLYTQNVFADII